jgi:tetratricopeptide (TPR) repeat protein
MSGSALGEPVAEDFDFLDRALFHGTGSLLDGGGSQAFWRPIPHQLYYAALGRAIVAAPALVTALHLVLLALAAVLWYRALRPAWPGPLAAAAAAFPLLAESTRTIAGWPTQFVDLGLYLFSALAVHETTRRRLPGALAALLAALLCKEVAVVTAVLLPVLPLGPRGRRERMRWAAGSAGVLAAWGLATLAVRQRAHLALPELTRSPEALATPFLARLGWSVGGSLKAIASLALLPGPHDALVMVALALLLGVAGVALATSRDAQARFVRQAPWFGWGLAWFLLASASLTAVYPSWQPNRSQYGSAGLGVAAAAALGAVHPALVGALVVVRLGALALAPGAVRTVEEKAPESGAFMDYARLTRLQRFMRDTRHLLLHRYPKLPHGAIVVQENLPHSLEYAFGGDHALRVWYADSTLHWMRFDAFRAHPDTPVTVVVQGEPGHAPEVALVEADAVRELFRAQPLVAQHRFPEVLAALDRADAAQRDSNAVQFWVASWSWRAYAYALSGRASDGVALAERAVARGRSGGLSRAQTDVVARQVLALALAQDGRYDRAFAHLDTLEGIVPGDSTTRSLRGQIEAVRAAKPAPPGPGGVRAR